MVTIVPADDTLRQELCAADMGSAVECLVLLDGNRQAGYILYAGEGSALRIVELRTKQPMFADGLLRAAMNRALAQGMDRAVCAVDDLKPMLFQMGFVAQGNDAAVSLRGFFDKPCCGRTL